MYTVVFLSRHEASPLMMRHLNDIYRDFYFHQYQGTFSDIKVSERSVTWIDSLEGEIKTPSDSVIIAVAPPQLQILFLNAIKFSGNQGVLLQPLTERVINPETNQATFEYVGLSHVKAIVFDTKLIAGYIPQSQRHG